MKLADHGDRCRFPRNPRLELRRWWCVLRAFPDDGGLEVTARVSVVARARAAEILRLKGCGPAAFEATPLA